MKRPSPRVPDPTAIGRRPQNGSLGKCLSPVFQRSTLEIGLAKASLLPVTAM
jgi:hypothetical protein